MADGSVQTSTRGSSRPVLVRYHRKNKRNTRHPVIRLPFVAKDETGRQSFWAMPKCDGYGTGTDMGNAAGRAFMKALRSSPEESAGTLQYVVLDLVRAAGAEGDEARTGQIVGFFSYLDAWLRCAAIVLGSPLDNLDEREIESVMSRAATETEQDYGKRLDNWLNNRRSAAEV